MEKIKLELNKIVPKELEINVDYWLRISDNIRSGIVFLPISFIHYLSFKYNYDLEVLKSPEIMKHIWGISIEIFKSKNMGFSSIFSNYNVNITTKSKVKENKVKNRDELCSEIPLADFIK